MPTLRIGLVGCGGISGVHLEGWKKLNPDCQVVALCDIDKTALDRRGDQYAVPTAQRYLDHRDLLKKADVDAIDICVPNKAHTPITVNALKAGKHVLCEKPLAPTPADIQKMIAARNKAKKILMTAQHERFDRSSQRLKAFLETGPLGDIYYARAHFLRRRFLPVRPGFIDKNLSGGGPCIDIGVHVLDLALHFMGNPEPVSVTGITPQKLAKRKDIKGWWGEWDRQKINVEDFAAGFIRFKNGGALSLECSWLLNQREPEYQKIWLYGTDAGAEWPALEVFSEKAGSLTDTKLTFRDDRADGHHTELAAFRDAIWNNAPSPVPAEQSLQVCRILNGLYRSYASGKEVRV